MIKSFLKTRTATWLLSLILFFGMIVTARILVEQRRVNKEIAKLEQQADKIQQDNEQLSYLIDYFSTEDYEEKQAREKLNLKREGEYVVSLPVSVESEDSQEPQPQDPNTKKWFDYFFGHESD